MILPIPALKSGASDDSSWQGGRGAMSTILVEARRDPAPAKALDQIAATCRDLGHDLFRWRGPLSGRVPYWRRVFPCDLAILWNGSHPAYRQIVAALRRRGAAVLLAELGWHPQKDTIQIDPAGINARASWAGQPLTAMGRTPLPVRQVGDLLVVLQLDRDTQITQLSPWFADMGSVVELVCRHSALPVRVRAHPREPPGEDLRRRVESLGGTWDDSPSLAAALSRAKALACVNSSCGVEALAACLPVLCYGRAIYRHSGAVYCLRDDPEATQQATAALAAGHCGLFCEPIAELLGRIREHQWPLAEIPQRLPRLLEQGLIAAELSTARHASWLGPLIRWTRDLPPRLLPRAA
jgi:hypothetical protein